MWQRPKNVPLSKHAYYPGEKVGMMTLIEYEGWKSGRGKWLAVCECGNKRSINPHQYRIGKSRSCGCYYMCAEHRANIGKGQGGYQKVQLRDPKNIRLLRSFRGEAAEEFIDEEFRHEPS